MQQQIQAVWEQANFTKNSFFSSFQFLLSLNQTHLRFVAAVINQLPVQLIVVRHAFSRLHDRLKSNNSGLNSLRNIEFQEVHQKRRALKVTLQSHKKLQTSAKRRKQQAESFYQKLKSLSRQFNQKDPLKLYDRKYLTEVLAQIQANKIQFKEKLSSLKEINRQLLMSNSFIEKQCQKFVKLVETFIVDINTLHFNMVNRFRKIYSSNILLVWDSLNEKIDQARDVSPLPQKIRRLRLSLKEISEIVQRLFNQTKRNFKNHLTTISKFMQPHRVQLAQFIKQHQIQLNKVNKVYINLNFFSNSLTQPQIDLETFNRTVAKIIKHFTQGYEQVVNWINQRSSLSQIQPDFQINFSITSQAQDFAQFIMKGQQLIQDLSSLTVPEQIQQTYKQDYSCALGGKLLLQGRLYIGRSSIRFQSSFNKKNLFFGQTVLQIPYKDIKQVRKVSSLIIQNSIQIEFQMHQIYFTSLIYRDNAYDDLLSAIQTYRQQKDEPSQIVQAVQKTVFLPEEIVRIRNKAQIISSTYPQEMPFKVNQILIKNCNLQAYYQNLIRGKSAADIFAKAFVQAGNLAASIQQWQPQIPTFKQLILQDQKIYKRVLHYSSPVPKVPFFPDRCQNTQSQQLFVLDQKRLCIKGTVKIQGVPYADSISCRLMSHYQDKEGDLLIRITGQVRINQDTFLKNTLISQSQKKMKSSSKTINSILQRHFRKCVSIGSKGQALHCLQPVNSLKTLASTLQTDRPDLGSELSHLKHRVKMLQWFILGLFLIILLK